MLICIACVCLVSSQLRSRRLSFSDGGAAVTMGRHLTDSELDQLVGWQAAGVTTPAMHERLAKQRRRTRQEVPDITTVRRALKGTTHKRGRSETRGRKRKLSATTLKKIDVTRDKEYEKVGGEGEIPLDTIRKRARAPEIHRTNVARSLERAGLGVKFRSPRQKPMRAAADEADRKRKCNKYRKLPSSFWQKTVVLYMDNKRWDIPTTAKGKRFLKMKKVRGHWRKRSGGLKKYYTKPNVKKHKVNVGGSVNVCAGIIGGRVRVWHYLPTRWCGDEAANVYKTVIAPALRRWIGNKKKFISLEDNDPTGYRSNLAIAEKAKQGIQPIQFPTYSPDINPCDYALWDEVQRRMDGPKAPKNETADAFKRRLRRTALSIPEKVVRKMLSGMVPRMEAVYQNDGGHIPRD